MLDWLTDRDERDTDTIMFFGVGVAVVLLLSLVVYIGIREENRWSDYAAAHHCQAKGTKKGEWEPVAGGRGGVAIGSDQTIYVCDGGEIIIR